MVVFDEAQRFAAEAPEDEESKALANRLSRLRAYNQKIRSWLDVHNPGGGFAEARHIRTTASAKLRLRSHLGNRATKAQGNNWRSRSLGTLPIVRRPSGHPAITVPIHAHGAGIAALVYWRSSLSLGIHGLREVSESTMASPPSKSDIQRLESAIREGTSQAEGSGRPEAVLREHVQPVLEDNPARAGSSFDSSRRIHSGGPLNSQRRPTGCSPGYARACGCYLQPVRYRIRASRLTSPFNPTLGHQARRSAGSAISARSS